VGKSSLLNMLSGKGDLARVSATPGSTRLINFFTMNRHWRLVDLPGYGYAHVARKDMAQFNQAVSDYIELRPNLFRVFALIDSGLPPQKIDLEFVEWLAVNSVPFVLVFTKTDKIKPTPMRANMAAFMDRISAWNITPPQTFTCSAKTKHGRSELLSMIAATIAAERSERGLSVPDEKPLPDPAPAAERKSKAREGCVTRPNPARPW
jgi:GTP-binding protein